MPGSWDGLDGGFRQRLEALIAASGGSIYLVSGYRSPQRQAQLYAAAVKKYGQAGAGKWVAPPGKSNHGRGIAADLGFTTAGARQWAHANASRFGLRFPMGHEPWHIEPIDARDRSPREAYTDPPAGSTVAHAQDPAPDNFDLGTQMDRLVSMMSAPAPAGGSGIPGSELLTAPQTPTLNPEPEDLANQVVQGANRA